MGVGADFELGGAAGLVVLVETGSTTGSLASCFSTGVGVGVGSGFGFEQHLSHFCSPHLSSQGS